MKGLSFILLGSNMGNREELLNEAIEQIELRCGKLVLKSSLYESEPWGFDADIYFLNQAIAIESVLSPHDLLNELLTIEAELGRKRKENHIGYESRPIDLDIIYYEDIINSDEDLILPHPRLHLRRFVLMPICEIAPDFIHPILQETNSGLLERCEDYSEVRMYQSH
jgi:2-amino-4-hydroxy-6-hydroxymethyldihydropteridine diphosphokinase